MALIVLESLLVIILAVCAGLNFAMGKTGWGIYNLDLCLVWAVLLSLDVAETRT